MKIELFTSVRFNKNKMNNITFKTNLSDEELDLEILRLKSLYETLSPLTITKSKKKIKKSKSFEDIMKDIQSILNISDEQILMNNIKNIISSN